MCGIASPRRETWRDTHDDGRDARLALPRRPPHARRHLPPRDRPPARPAVADRRYRPRTGTHVRAQSTRTARSTPCPGVCGCSTAADHGPRFSLKANRKACLTLSRRAAVDHGGPRLALNHGRHGTPRGPAMPTPAGCPRVERTHGIAHQHTAPAALSGPRVSCTASAGVSGGRRRPRAGVVCTLLTFLSNHPQDSS